MLRILRTNPDIAEASGLGDLLRERRERPHSSTAQKRDKYASPHGGEMRERGSRAIRLTAAGLHGLRAVFGMEVPDTRSLRSLSTTVCRDKFKAPAERCATSH